MGKRVLRRAPRAHWALLVLASGVLLAELSLHGYVTHVGAEGDGPLPGTGSAPAPAAVTGGAAVQRLGPGDAVSSRGMPARTIALTFDDGPDPRWTPRILDVLARHRAHATFFQVGSQVNEHPGLARRVLAEGHEIGSHTFSHAGMPGLADRRLDAELTLTANAVAAATGRRPVLLRPPYSSVPSAVTVAEQRAHQRAAEAGYLLVLTDLDTGDWRRPGADAIVAAAQPEGDTGAVVMMHDSGGDRAQTVAALDRLIPALQAKGYRFVTVSEGLGLAAMPAAGTGQRWRGYAFRAAQTAGDLLADALAWLVLVAVVLAVLRLMAQLVSARVHMRRRRRDDRPLEYVGPVSVIVPAYNEAATIAATVRSLVRSDYPAVEVIVVDDGSTDGTADIVERLGLLGVYVLRQPNAGKPAALNHGIGYAQHDILVLVDGDTVFEPDAVGRLVQPLRDPRVGAVSGNTKVGNRGGLLGRWQHLEYVIGFNLDRRMFDVAGFMPTVPGAIGAFRREALDAAGGVSAQTLAEDTDLTMAVLRGGRRVVHEPAAVAWTEAPASLRQLWRQRYRWCYGTMQAMWKHRHALRERGDAARAGRRCLGYLLLFQVLLPLTAPMVDVYALYGTVFLEPATVVGIWAGFTAVQMVTAAYALHLDGERWTPLWSLPLQQIVYRQLMYLVVIQSTVMALLGGRLRWHRMARTGAATARVPEPERFGPLWPPPPRMSRRPPDLQALPVGGGRRGRDRWPIN
ncbi:bifunctional polysaccharide deacetylase/glycosyltransferase family 2 protein [Actinoplanes sp. NPDC051475]|uniref:bifunctional polysaccharide deacetylase/glycosyltransferase family 2 protein n=1 Tax=Actinoplanes sp. NPDC051475 TaxID=3157225 RepID=UPI0034509D8A